MTSSGNITFSIAPETGLPVPGLETPIDLEWNIGHTIRPNGEVLEGNPAEAAEWIPFTRDTASTYFEDLIARAIRYLDN